MGSPKVLHPKGLVAVLPSCSARANHFGGDQGQEILANKKQKIEIIREGVVEGELGGVYVEEGR